MIDNIRMQKSTEMIGVDDTNSSAIIIGLSTQ